MRTPVRRRSPLAATALTAVAALALTACSSAQDTAASADGKGGAEVVLRVPDPGNSGFLAKGKKDGSLDAALAAAHAKVVWTGSAGPFAPAAQALNADQLDVAQGSITSAVAALAQKPGFKLFAQTEPDQAGEGILVKNGSPIKEIKDLVGKKVAVSQGGTSEYLLLKALEKNGVPADRVQRVYLRADQTSGVFNSGQVDAWATWGTFSIPAIANAGAHFLADGKAVGSDNYAVWAVRSAFAEKHPEVVGAFYGYLHENGAKEKADPAAYLNVFTDAGPTAVTPAEQAVAVDFGKQRAVDSPITDADAARFAVVAKFYADQGVTKTLVDVKPYLLDVNSLPGGGK
ncbi:ABC transporter substrate-binding protein [Kitasatospora cineracea]|uniref:Sulfonate transport system substrate-binding protein n=1 Tax=Kitasatospora cineracea TaxID=88074 RepID=A0A3N4R5Y7_9ACTN|nr:NrtA/SsuA/CpmA family ABC transporter substrate-binding protein [Kitasatospora cineracea]RPE28943.1 sulfonate transport system substrate-binding protein [Kitasatospora cineracea]